MGTLCDRPCSLYEARLRRLMNNRARCRTADRRFNRRFQIGKHQLNPEELAKKMEEVAADTQQFSTMK